MSGLMDKEKQALPIVAIVLWAGSTALVVNTLQCAAFITNLASSKPAGHKQRHEVGRVQPVPIEGLCERLLNGCWINVLTVQHIFQTSSELVWPQATTSVMVTPFSFSLIPVHFILILSYYYIHINMNICYHINAWIATYSYTINTLTCCLN